MKTRSYPHLKIEKVEQIEHRHPRKITNKTEIQTEDGTLVITTTQDSEMSTNAIPKQLDPNIRRIITPPFSLKRYEGQKKTLVSDKNGKWLGSLEYHDLKNLYHELGGWFKDIKAKGPKRSQSASKKKFKKALDSENKPEKVP